jgi:hypothetical protein
MCWVFGVFFTGLLSCGTKQTPPPPNVTPPNSQPSSPANPPNPAPVPQPPSVGDSCFSVPPAPPYTGPDPAAGWAAQAVSFTYQGPPNLPESARHTSGCGIEHLWIMPDDQPLAGSVMSSGQPTRPRAELLFTGAGAFSSTTQLALDIWVPSGTTGVTVAQDKGPGHEEMELQVDNGNFTYWSSNASVTSMSLGASVYDKWVHVNILHDMGAQTSAVYLNGKLSGSGQLPGNSFNFKCGTYDQSATQESDAYFTNIHVYTPGACSSLGGGLAPTNGCGISAG